MYFYPLRIGWYSGEYMSTATHIVSTSNAFCIVRIIDTRLPSTVCFQVRVECGVAIFDATYIAYTAPQFTHRSMAGSRITTFITYLL